MSNDDDNKTMPVPSDSFDDTTVQTTESSTVASSCGDVVLPVYRPTSSEGAQSALQILKERLAERLESGGADNLRLESMRESFDLELLTSFYNQLMIPNFPLEEERDDLEDWLLCLDPANKEELEEQEPSMDVLILRIEDTILGGIAFEYYPQAQAGLLSYMVVSTNFRRLGILATLHPVFRQALESLHQVCSRTSSNTKIRAILAETNTPHAGDVPEAVARKRHEILYKLGYRLLQFPYVQPPLATDGESFDDIMLLIHVGGDQDETASISSQVLHDYVVDFYHSVFGYQSQDFHHHWYYKLVTWYAKRYPSTKIQPDLPWEDVTPKMKQLMQQEEEG